MHPRFSALCSYEIVNYSKKTQQNYWWLMTLFLDFLMANRVSRISVYYH